MNERNWVKLVIYYILAFFMINLIMTQLTLVNNAETAIKEQAEVEAKENNEIKTVEYELSLMIIEDNQEVWKTYTVDVIEAREQYGTYWIDNSKTEGYIIKVDFDEYGYVHITEHTDDRIKVRHLASVKGGNITIKEYKEIEEVDNIEDESGSNEQNSSGTI